MIVMSVEEFAAKRRNDQTDLEDEIYPHVAQAIEDFGKTGWQADLLRFVQREYLQVFHREGGTGLPTPSAASFTADVSDTLDKTRNPTQETVNRISIWLSTAILNAGTQAAVNDDPEFVLMEWVTMHDSDVRAEHAATEGQQRPTTEPYDVAGVPMRYPGDPTAPIELWINCRCSLAPVLAADAQFAERPGIGGYPIDNCEDLRNAIQAIGRAKPEERAKTIAHIKTQKKRLGCPEVELPDTEGWSNEEEVTMTTTETEQESVMDAPLAWHGVLAPEGVWSGDGRQFAPDALRFRDLPLPLTWQKATDAGHDGSIVVGAIRSIERVDGMMRASGTFLRTPEADEVVGLLVEFGKFGVSVDADDAEFEFDETSDKVTFTSARIASASIVSIPAFAEAYIALGTGEETAAMDEGDVCDPESPAYDEAACLEKQPASAEVEEFDRGPGWVTNPEDTKRLHDYWTKPGEEGYAKINWGVGGDFNRCRALVGEKIAENSPEDSRFLNQICAQWHHDALGYWPAEHDTASTTNTTFTNITWGQPYISGTTTWTTGTGLTITAGGGRKAPAAWFKNPELSGPTHLTVTDDGQVYGHIAEWTACHIGYDSVCVSPPHTNHAYAYFASKSVLLDDNTFAKTGVISLGGGHAKDRMRLSDVTSHYDSTSTAVADVCVGEDEWGIWCAGWIRPGTTDDQIVALRASDVSGDWREIGGELELVAALAVNVGGFPTVSVGVEGGVQVSLVAAGAIRGPHEQDVFDELAEKVEEAIAARAARRDRMRELATRQERRDRMREIAARVEGVE